MTGGRWCCLRRRYLQNWADMEAPKMNVMLLQRVYRVQNLQLTDGMTCTCEGVIYDEVRNEVTVINMFTLLDYSQTPVANAIIGKYFSDMPEDGRISFENVPVGYDTNGVITDILDRLKEVLPV